MHAVEEYATLDKVIIPMPLFSRGKELLQLEIIKVLANEPGRLFSIDDFLNLTTNKRKIRVALDALVARGHVKRLNSYPRFYCFIVAINR